MPSLLDPFGLGSVAKQAVKVGVQVAGWTQGQLVGALRSVLDNSAPTQQLTAGSPASAGGSAAKAPERTGDGSAQREDLDLIMGRLLDQSLLFGAARSRDELFRKVLNGIVPDEARIIGALSDGSHSPAMSVYTRGGAAPELALMSLIARTANLSLPDLTPTYVHHLISLGLLETGPEDPALTTEYEILSAEVAILAAIKRAKRTMLPARVERSVIQLSPLGLELCVATGLAGA